MAHDAEACRASQHQPHPAAAHPQEGVWQFIRQNWLSNRIFFGYDNLLDHCCDAWNNLVQQPWTIMSIGLRPWAHGF